MLLNSLRRELTDKSFRLSWERAADSRLWRESIKTAADRQGVSFVFIWLSLLYWPAFGTGGSMPIYELYEYNEYRYEFVSD